MLFEDGHEMISVLFASVLDAKIVYTKRKGDWVPNMRPETWGELALVITFSVQTFFQKLLCKESALRKSIHPAPYLNIDVPIFGDFGGKVVLIDKIIGEVA